MESLEGMGVCRLHPEAKVIRPLSSRLLPHLHLASPHSASTVAARGRGPGAVGPSPRARCAHPGPGTDAPGFCVKLQPRSQVGVVKCF